MKKVYSTEEVYEIVSLKWNVDFSDGSCDMFELMSKANSMGFIETTNDVWEKSSTTS